MDPAIAEAARKAAAKAEEDRIERLDKAALAIRTQQEAWREYYADLDHMTMTSRELQVDQFDRTVAALDELLINGEIKMETY